MDNGDNNEHIYVIENMWYEMISLIFHILHELFTLLQAYGGGLVFYFALIREMT